MAARGAPAPEMALAKSRLATVLIKQGAFDRGAIKRDPFLFERPSRHVSFMRWLDGSGHAWPQAR